MTQPAVNELITQELAGYTIEKIEIGGNRLILTCRPDAPDNQVPRRRFLVINGNPTAGVTDSQVVVDATLKIAVKEEHPSPDIN